MRLRSALWCVGLMSLASATPAGEQRVGARALYYDPTTGATVNTGEQPAAGKKPAPLGRTEGEKKSDSKGKTDRQKAHADTPLAEPAAATAVATGVKYFMELLGDRGQLLRVNSNRVFHSGERFRLMVESNVNGRLTILQTQNGGSYQRLFPDARVRGGSDRIQALVTTALPSDTGWFRFDDQTGEIRLLLMVTPDPGPDKSVAPAPSGHGQPASGRMVAGYDAEADAQAIAAAQKRGSRALLVEEDTTPTAPATFCAMPPGPQGQPAELAIEIRLRHER